VAFDEAGSPAANARIAALKWECSSDKVKVALQIRAVAIPGLPRPSESDPTQPSINTIENTT
jgi:hypothetical protein